MISMETLGWIAIVLILVVSVSTAIIQPIYDKAVDQKEEIEDIEFDDPTSYIDDSVNEIYAAMDYCDILS